MPRTGKKKPEATLAPQSEIVSTSKTVTVPSEYKPFNKPTVHPIYDAAGRVEANVSTDDLLAMLKLKQIKSVSGRWTFQPEPEAGT